MMNSHPVGLIHGSIVDASWRLPAPRVRIYLRKWAEISTRAMPNPVRPGEGPFMSEGLLFDWGLTPATLPPKSTSYAVTAATPSRAIILVVAHCSRIALRRAYSGESYQAIKESMSGNSTR